MIGSSHSHTLNVSVSYYMWWVRTDNSGNMLWNQPYQHGDSAGSGSGLVECSDGGFALASSTRKNGLYSYDQWLVRITANGDIVWENTYGDPAYIEYSQAVVECSGGGFALAGFYNGSHNDSDFYLVRVDTNGNTLWEQTYGTDSDDFGLGMGLCGNGDYALVGITGEYGYEQAMLMRIPAIIIPGFFLPVDPLLLIGVIIVILVLGVFLWRRRRLAVSEV